MKKVLSVCLASLLLVGCTNKQTSTTTNTNTSTNNNTSSTQTEDTNTTTKSGITITNPITLNSTQADMSGYQWIRGDVANFQEITLGESLRMFEEGGTGILYYGYDTCQWCNRAVPELNEVAKEFNLTIYYVDASQRVERDEYAKLLEYIDPVLEVDSKGEKGFYVPAIIGVKDGKITDFHVSLVDNFEIPQNDPNKQLSDDQKQQLRDIYTQIAEKTAD